MTAEPTPIRDNGPYQNARQAMGQFGAQTYGMPMDEQALKFSVLREAAMLASLEVTSFEEQELTNIAWNLTPSEVTVLAGMILRAHVQQRAVQ